MLNETTIQAVGTGYQSEGDIIWIKMVYQKLLLHF